MTAKNVWTVLKVPSFVIICVEHVIGSLSWSQGYRVMYFQVCPALILDPCLCSLSLEALRLAASCKATMMSGSFIWRYLEVVLPLLQFHRH